IGAVGAIVLPAEADKKTVGAEKALERADDRNRAAIRREYRLAAPFSLKSPAGEAYPWALLRNRDAGTVAALGGEAHPAVLGQALPDELFEAPADTLRILPAHQAESELRGGE